MGLENSDTDASVAEKERTKQLLSEIKDYIEKLK
jgi:hypothetical protein